VVVPMRWHVCCSGLGWHAPELSSTKVAQLCDVLLQHEDSTDGAYVAEAAVSVAAGTGRAVE